MAAKTVSGGAWTNLGIGSVPLQYLGAYPVLIAITAAAPAIPPVPGVGFAITFREASTPQEVGDTAGVNSIWATPQDQKMMNLTVITQ